ncbi:hypothetical protein [Promicromonospora sp. NPDC050249]|uniref:hypothetical protein n=1 Tax=Promicromonospora sp. NPDC050249 TaxID=3154743 RepID=UPI0033D5DC18
MTAIVSVALGALLTFLVQWMLSGRQARHEVAKEDRESRRSLYVRVALAFDQINHLILEWIRLDLEGKAGEDADRVRTGYGLAEAMNLMTALASEVEITGHPVLAEFLHDVASRENLPLDEHGHNRLISDVTSDEWEDFRRKLLHQRGNAVALMRVDIEALSGRLAPWPIRAIWAWRARRALREAGSTAETGVV